MQNENLNNHDVDEDWYTKEYPHVKIMGMNATMHYTKFGKRLNYRPNSGPNNEIHSYEISDDFLLNTNHSKFNQSSMELQQSLNIDPEHTFLGGIETAEKQFIRGWIQLLSENSSDDYTLVLKLNDTALLYAKPIPRREARESISKQIYYDFEFNFQNSDAYNDIRGRILTAFGNGRTDAKMSVELLWSYKLWNSKEHILNAFALPNKFADVRELKEWGDFFDMDINEQETIQHCTKVTPVNDFSGDSAKVIAYFLPQFYPFEENDRWWGPGFTEWTGVATASKQFDEHTFPNIPADLGFYDLRVKETRKKQGELAKAYGVYGFCYYFYWFSGRRLMQKPIELMLEDREPNLPFCLCWANEPWSRRWDGSESEVLMSQNHDADEDLAILDSLLPYFEDDRYIRIDNKPLIVIYRITLMKNAKEFIEKLREKATQAGLPGLYICSATTFGATDGRAYGCDTAVEFPPHNFEATRYPEAGLTVEPGFTGTIYDYRDAVSRYLTRDEPNYPYIPAVMPRWDNTARKHSSANVYHGSTPDVFEAYLHHAVKTTLRRNPDAPLVFINSWNEWGEGAHLEPDRRYGHKYLDAVRRAITSDKSIYSETAGLTDLEQRLVTENKLLVESLLRHNNKLMQTQPVFEGDPVILQDTSIIRAGSLHVENVAGGSNTFPINATRLGVSLTGWAAGTPLQGVPCNSIAYLIFNRILDNKKYFSIVMERLPRLDVHEHFELKNDNFYYGFKADLNTSNMESGSYLLSFIEVIDFEITKVGHDVNIIIN